MKPKSNVKANPNIVGNGIANLMTRIRGLFAKKAQN